MTDEEVVEKAREVTENVLGRQIDLGQAVLSVTWREMIFQFLLPVLGMLVTYRIIKWILLRGISRSRLSSQRQAALFRWLRLLLQGVTLGGIGLLAYFLMKDDLSEWGRGFLRLFQLEFKLGGEHGASISITSLLLLIPIFYISSWAGRTVRRMLDSSLISRLGVDESRRSSAGNLIRYGVMTLVFLFCLNTFIGIDFSALGSLLVTFGIGIGFGLQNVIGNFFSGLAILFSRPIKEHDRILVDGYEGEVVQIRLLSTVVKTLQNEDIIIPNSKITNSSVYNFTYEDRKILIKNKVGVSYESDLDRALELLIEVAKSSPFTDRRVQPKARLEGFGESAVELVLVSWISDVSKKYEALSHINLEIWRKFGGEGIEIPYPHVSVKMLERDSVKEG